MLLSDSVELYRWRKHSRPTTLYEVTKKVFILRIQQAKVGNRALETSVA